MKLFPAASYRLFICLILVCISSLSNAQARIEQHKKTFTLLDDKNLVLIADCDYILNVSCDTMEAYIVVKENEHTYWKKFDGNYLKCYHADLTDKKNADHDELFDERIDKFDKKLSWIHLSRAVSDHSVFIGRDNDLCFVYDLDGKYELPLTEISCLQSNIDFHYQTAYFWPKHDRFLMKKNGKFGLSTIKGKVFIAHEYDELHETDLSWRNEEFHSYYYHLGLNKALKKWYVFDEKYRIIDSVSTLEYPEFVAVNDSLLLFSTGAEVKAYNPIKKRSVEGCFEHDKYRLIYRSCPILSGVVNNDGKIIIPFDGHRIRMKQVGDREYYFISGRNRMAVCDVSGNVLWESQKGGEVDVYAVGDGPYFVSFGTYRKEGILKIDKGVVEVLFPPNYASIQLQYYAEKGIIGKARTAENESVRFYADGTERISSVKRIIPN